VALSSVSLELCTLRRRQPLCLDLDLRDACLGEANLLGGSLREVELPALHIRPTVINRHIDRLAGFEIGHFGLRSQRQRPMGCSQGMLIERLTARRLLAVETRPIPGGRADLGGLGVFLRERPPLSPGEQARERPSRVPGGQAAAARALVSGYIPLCTPAT